MIDHYIKEHGKRLYGLCRTLCKNLPDAEDLYQDTWLKAMANISRFESAKPFEPWLTQICVNNYRNALRRLARSPIVNGFTTSEEKDRAMESVHMAPPGDYCDLHAAIDRLPEKLRLVIVLFYFQDMDIRCTAQVLRIPEGTAKSRLNKAKLLLKEDLHNGENL